MEKFFNGIRSLGVNRGGSRLIGGVCGGIADRFGINPWIVRIAFIASMLLPGPQVLFYIIAWILLPNGQGQIPLESSLKKK